MTQELVDTFMESAVNVYKRVYENDNENSLSGFLPHITENYHFRDEEEIGEEKIEYLKEAIREECWDDDYWLELFDNEYRYVDELDERLFDYFNRSVDSIEDETETVVVFPHLNYVFVPTGTEKFIGRDGSVDIDGLLTDYMSNISTEGILKVAELVRAGSPDEEDIQRAFPMIDFEEEEQVVKQAIENLFGEIEQEIAEVESSVGSIIEVSETAKSYFDEDMDDESNLLLGVLYP